MLRKTTIACSLSASLLLVGAAAADDVTPAASPVRFTSLAPDGMRSEIGARVGLGMIDNADETLISVQLEAQYMTPGNLGGYLRISGGMIEDSEGVGDLELGGLYRIDSGPDTSIALRGGLSLPTGTSLQNFDAIGNYVGVLMTRPSDLVTVLPDVLALRLSVAPTYRTGAVVLRADVGFDVPLSQDNGDMSPLVHADVGLGVHSGKGAATAELATLGSTDSDAEGTVHAVTLGGQYDAGAVTPSVSLAIPFSSEDNNFIDGYTLLFGVSGGL